MKRLFFLFALIAMSSQARATLTIEITQGAEGALPIAVVPFAWRGSAASPPPHAVGEVVADAAPYDGLLAGMLVRRGWRPVSTGEETALIDGALALGREMLLRKEISTEAALSRPLFASALRLARHRRLLDADDPGVVQRREAFAADVQQALAAINLLQDVYDRPLNGFPSPDVRESLSIA